MAPGLSQNQTGYPDNHSNDGSQNLDQSLNVSAMPIMTPLTPTGTNDLHRMHTLNMRFTGTGEVEGSIIEQEMNMDHSVDY